MKKGTLILVLVLVGLILVVGGYFLSHRSHEHPGETLSENPGTQAPATPGAQTDQYAIGSDTPAETPAEEPTVDE